MRQDRHRGNIPHDRFVSDTLHDILGELKKTNTLLQKLVTEMEAEGPAEKLGKALDGRKKRK